MRLSGHRFLADLVPVLELFLKIAVRADLAGVDQVGEEKALLLNQSQGETYISVQVKSRDSHGRQVEKKRGRCWAWER